MGLCQAIYLIRNSVHSISYDIKTKWQLRYDCMKGGFSKAAWSNDLPEAATEKNMKGILASHTG